MKNTNTDNHLTIGSIGEDLAVKFLVKTGFLIKDRNYRKKWGEIDIVALYSDIVHFVEVKTVSCEIINNDVARATFLDSYRPEDNIHSWKLKRLSRAIQSYITEGGINNAEWQFDIICVYMDIDKRLAKVDYSPNIVL